MVPGVTQALYSCSF